MENTLGGRLCALRKRRGMTQEALAAELGVTNQSVSKWELGQSMPDIALLPVLADVFATSIDSLLGYSAACPLDAVAEQVRTLFRGTPPAEVFALAVRLAGVLHEGVFTLGYTKDARWQLPEAVGDVDWGFSARSEKEGTTVRNGCAVFFSATQAGGQADNPAASIYPQLQPLADLHVLRVLFALEDGEAKTMEALMEASGLDAQEVKAALMRLPVDMAVDGVKLRGCYLHVPQVLRLLVMQ